MFIENDRARRTIINNFKETIKFADLKPTDIMDTSVAEQSETDISEHEEDTMQLIQSANDESKVKQPPVVKPTVGYRVLSLTLNSGDVASIQIPVSINEEELDFLKESLIKYIELFKKRLLSEKPVD